MTTFPAGTTALPEGWDPTYWDAVYRDGRFIGCYAPDMVWIPVEVEIVYAQEAQR